MRLLLWVVAVLVEIQWLSERIAGLPTRYTLCVSLLSAEVPFGVMLVRVALLAPGYPTGARYYEGTYWSPSRYGNSEECGCAGYVQAAPMYYLLRSSSTNAP